MLFAQLPLIQCLPMAKRSGKPAKNFSNVDARGSLEVAEVQRIGNPRGGAHDFDEVLRVYGCPVELSHDGPQPDWQVPGGSQPRAGRKTIHSKQKCLLLGYVEWFVS